MKQQQKGLVEIEHYLFSVGWSSEDEAYISRVAEFPSLTTHGETMEEALNEIKQVVGFVVQEMQESGEDIPEPFGQRSYSGKLNLRMPETLHRRLVIQAAQQGVSLNQIINLKLATI